MSTKLLKYHTKRDFDITPEPRDSNYKKQTKGLIFVVQKHAASHLHYDLRLELDGVLHSWAVPKGPSLDPSNKRLAQLVEDHPLEYATFEGQIPSGQYGGGTVMVWDTGTYVSSNPGNNEQNIKTGLAKGNLKIFLQGQKLVGNFALIKTKLSANSWLLIKEEDEYVSHADILQKDISVLTGRTMSEIAEPKLEALTNAKDSPLKCPPPMLPTPGEKLSDDGHKICEIKLDGYRCITQITKTHIQMLSRNGQSLNTKFRYIYLELAKCFAGRQIVFDGEIVALDKNGISSFTLLQNPKSASSTFYYVFDILYLDGKELSSLPLGARKEILDNTITKSLKYVRVNESISGTQARKFLHSAQKLGLEGVVCKNIYSTYTGGARTKDWQYYKFRQTIDVIICGFTKPKYKSDLFGALQVCIKKGNDYVYLGGVGTGFANKQKAELYKLLVPSTTDHSLVVMPGDLPVTYVDPCVVCELEYAELTADNKLRQASFVRLRPDKDPEDCIAIDTMNPKDSSAKQISVKPDKIKLITNPKDSRLLHGVELTHQDKLYFPKSGITKGDVANYYSKIATTILPHLHMRPQSLHRQMHGIVDEGFFEKNFVGGPDFLQTADIYSTEVGRDIRYILCNDLKTLLYLCNLGIIELNPWNSRIKSQDRPDYCIIDLDPHGVSTKTLVEVAQKTYEILQITGVPSFVKTSGKKGLHILIPLGAKYTHEESRLFAQGIANTVHKAMPKVTSVLRNPNIRKKRVYLDFLQNRAHQTLACAYSLRPVEGAPVSTPLMWSEVKPELDPKDFNIKTIFNRLEKYGDILQPLLKHKGIDMTKALAKLEKLV